MNLEVLTPPPFLPLDLPFLYGKLKLDTEGSPPTHPLDEMLVRYLETATRDAEKITKRAFIQQRLRLSVAKFVAGKGIELLRPPLIRVEQVAYYDLSNNLVLLDAADWYVAESGGLSQVRLATSVTPPSVYDRPDAVRIDYVAGYPPSGSPSATQEDYAGNVPPNILTGIWLGVQLQFENLTPDEYATTVKARDHFLSAEKVFIKS